MHIRRKILVVDDDDSVLSYLCSKLGELYEVIAVAEPRRVVATARREAPDVILCDIDMPRMSGGDVAAALAGDSATVGIPFIYLTSLISPEEARELDGYVSGRPGVSKRAPLSELTRQIEKALEPLAPTD